MRTIAFAWACLFLIGLGDRVLDARDQRQELVPGAQPHARNEVDTPFSDHSPAQLQRCRSVGRDGKSSSANSIAALLLTFQNPKVGWQAVRQSCKADVRRARCKSAGPRPILLRDSSTTYSRRACARLAALAVASRIGLPAANAGVVYDIGYIVARKADPNYRGPTPSTAGEDFEAEDRAEIQRLASLTKVVLFSLPKVSDGGPSFQQACNKCSEVKRALDEAGAKYSVVEYDYYYFQDSCYVKAIYDISGAGDLPCLFVKGKFVAGGDRIVALKKSGALRTIL